VPDPSQAAAGGFVEPRGTIRSVIGSVIAREVLGAIPPAEGGGVDAGASPLKRGDIAYLALLSDELVLFKAKRGAFKPKPTEAVIAAGPLRDVKGATVERGRIAGVLRVEFADGTTWEFDVPRVHLAATEAIAAHLSRR
jgi:hypothetical protein